MIKKIFLFNFNIVAFIAFYISQSSDTVLLEIKDSENEYQEKSCKLVKNIF
jgi:hypothetical protein